MPRSSLATPFPGGHFVLPRSVLLPLLWEAFPTSSPRFSTETLLWRGPGLDSICATAAASLEPPWVLSEDARAHAQPPFPALCFKTLDLLQPVHRRLIDITARPGAACSQPSATASRTMASLSRSAVAGAWVELKNHLGLWASWRSHPAPSHPNDHSKECDYARMFQLTQNLHSLLTFNPLENFCPFLVLDCAYSPN